jgi:hypothetical protein
LTKPVGPPHGGEALVLATKLAVATSPLASSSGGFEIKLDPSTGLQVRTATTFGPSFSERALTLGEGKVSLGVNFISASYEKLGDLSIDNMQLGSVQAPSPEVARVGTASLAISSQTLGISGMIGVTDKVDIGLPADGAGEGEWRTDAGQWRRRCCPAAKGGGVLRRRPPRLEARCSPLAKGLRSGRPRGAATMRLSIGDAGSTRVKFRTMLSLIFRVDEDDPSSRQRRVQCGVTVSTS